MHKLTLPHDVSVLGSTTYICNIVPLEPEPFMSILPFHDKTLFQDKCQLLCRASIDLKKRAKASIDLKGKANISK